MNKAYKAAISFAKTHHENFPVISFFIPKELRKHVAIIYWFARTADDFADEGYISQEERLQKLNEFEDRLTELLKGNFNSPFEEALSTTIKEKNLLHQLFYDLKNEIKQEEKEKRYKENDEMIND